MKKTMLLCALCLSAIASGQEDSGSGTASKTITFEYDSAGNRIARRVQEEQATATGRTKAAALSDSRQDDSAK